MIGTIEIDVTAANPQLPLAPIRAYKNSPTSVRLRNVPKAIGNWKITSVQIVAIYPDNAIRVGNCVLVGGVWVGTIEGSAKSGRSENGFTVFASGKDEHDNNVYNYVLGKGLIEIMNEDGSIDPEDTSSYFVRLYDTPPSEMYDGFMYPSTSGYVIWQNGEGHAVDARAMAFAQDAYDLASAAFSGAEQAGQVAANATTLAQNAGTVASQALALASEVNTSVASLGQSVASIGQSVASNTSRIGDIEALVPAQATTSNQLADKAFVNSSVQTATANFRGNWATWNDVPTDANDYPVDYAGNKTPTVNDYMVVQDAVVEGNEGTWRYKYSGTWATDGKNGWLPEYQVNEMPLTAAQLAAINSNITAAKVSYYDSTLDGLEALIDSI